MLAKSTEVLISKALIDSVISHDGFDLINNLKKNMMIWNKKIKILIINMFDVIKELWISSKKLLKLVRKYYRNLLYRK